MSVQLEGESGVYFESHGLRPPERHVVPAFTEWDQRSCRYRGVPQLMTKLRWDFEINNKIQNIKERLTEFNEKYNLFLKLQQEKKDVSKFNGQLKLLNMQECSGLAKVKKLLTAQSADIEWMKGHQLLSSKKEIKVNVKYGSGPWEIKGLADLHLEKDNLYTKSNDSVIKQEEFILKHTSYLKELGLL